MKVLSIFFTLFFLQIKRETYPPLQRANQSNNTISCFFVFFTIQFLSFFFLFKSYSSLPGFYFIFVFLLILFVSNATKFNFYHFPSSFSIKVLNQLRLRDIRCICDCMCMCMCSVWPCICLIKWKSETFIAVHYTATVVTRPRSYFKINPFGRIHFSWGDSRVLKAMFKWK